MTVIQSAKAESVTSRGLSAAQGWGGSARLPSGDLQQYLSAAELTAH